MLAVEGPGLRIRCAFAPLWNWHDFTVVLRQLDALQLPARHGVATPANRHPGSDVVILTSISDEAAKQKFLASWKVLKPCLRVMPQPNCVTV